ncbi:MAG: Fe-S cluster assembly ATPase SufC [Rubritalea sp.]|jgi:Fe-S cluster assembly ATP-binding protein|tara:strand:+ start:4982 stop:5728 length:747 start_codon:yes stop_codon:yes gene_type:complete
MSIIIKDLHAKIGDTEILKGVNLEIPTGQVHAIMGTNGSGKSTLSKVISGHEDYEVTSGSIEMDGKDILGLDVDERSRQGIFLAFQYPMEIPGVSNANFIRAALNARLAEGEELDAVAYYKNLYSKMDALEIDRTFTARSVNEGYSGGEKKRNEILQMSMLEPKYCILDETDSGLDIDALKVVSRGVNSLRTEDRGFLIITHYQRLLDYIKPDVVHVMHDGQIIKSGGPELALELEEQGYEQFKPVTA